MNNSVLVSNLADSVDADGLETIFSLIGDVRKAVIDGRGGGSVEMSTAEEARNCVLHFDGQKKFGKTLLVRMARR